MISFEAITAVAASAGRTLSGVDVAAVRQQAGAGSGNGSPRLTRRLAGFSRRRTPTTTSPASLGRHRNAISVLSAPSSPKSGMSPSGSIASLADCKGDLSRVGSSVWPDPGSSCGTDSDAPFGVLLNRLQAVEDGNRSPVEPGSPVNTAPRATLPPLPNAARTTHISALPLLSALPSLPPLAPRHDAVNSADASLQSVESKRMTHVALPVLPPLPKLSSRCTASERTASMRAGEIIADPVLGVVAPMMRPADGSELSETRGPAAPAEQVSSASGSARLVVRGIDQGGSRHTRSRTEASVDPSPALISKPVDPMSRFASLIPSLAAVSPRHSSSFSAVITGMPKSKAAPERRRQSIHITIDPNSSTAASTGSHTSIGLPPSPLRHVLLAPPVPTLHVTAPQLSLSPVLLAPPFKRTPTAAPAAPVLDEQTKQASVVPMSVAQSCPVECAKAQTSALSSVIPRPTQRADAFEAPRCSQRARQPSVDVPDILIPHHSVKDDAGASPRAFRSAYAVKQMRQLGTDPEDIHPDMIPSPAARERDRPLLSAARRKFSIDVPDMVDVQAATECRPLEHLVLSECTTPRLESLGKSVVAAPSGSSLATQSPLPSITFALPTARAALRRTIAWEDPIQAPRFGAQGPASEPVRSHKHADLMTTHASASDVDRLNSSSPATAPSRSGSSNWLAKRYRRIACMSLVLHSASTTTVRGDF